MIVAIGLSATVGCFVAPRSIDEDDETRPDPTRSFEGGTVGSSDDASKGADSSSVNDPSGRCIPQDLKDLLDAECSSYHGAVPKKGAETILSFTDLVSFLHGKVGCRGVPRSNEECERPNAAGRGTCLEPVGSARSLDCGRTEELLYGIKWRRRSS